MKVIEVVRVETSDTESDVAIQTFRGPQQTKIHALLINEGAHGYGKFSIPEITLDAYMTKFYMIESSLNRKLSMNMMFDNVKSGKMAASRLIKILLNNLEHETAVDVL